MDSASYHENSIIMVKEKKKKKKNWEFRQSVNCIMSSLVFVQWEKTRLTICDRTCQKA